MRNPKPYTHDADRLATSATNMFTAAHDQLVEAQRILDEGMAADQQEVNRLQSRMTAATEARIAHEHARQKLAEFIPATNVLP